MNKNFNDNQKKKRGKKNDIRRYDFNKKSKSFKYKKSKLKKKFPIIKKCKNKSNNIYIKKENNKRLNSNTTDNNRKNIYDIEYMLNGIIENKIHLKKIDENFIINLKRIYDINSLWFNLKKNIEHIVLKYVLKKKKDKLQYDNINFYIKKLQKKEFNKTKEVKENLRKEEDNDRKNAFQQKLFFIEKDDTLFEFDNEKNQIVLNFKQWKNKIKLLLKSKILHSVKDENNKEKNFIEKNIEYNNIPIYLKQIYNINDERDKPINNINLKLLLKKKVNMKDIFNLLYDIGLNMIYSNYKIFMEKFSEDDEKIHLEIIHNKNNIFSDRINNIVVLIKKNPLVYIVYVQILIDYYQKKEDVFIKKSILECLKHIFLFVLPNDNLQDIHENNKDIINYILNILFNRFNFKEYNFSSFYFFFNALIYLYAFENFTKKLFLKYIFILKNGLYSLIPSVFYISAKNINEFCLKKKENKYANLNIILEGYLALKKGNPLLLNFLKHIITIDNLRRYITFFLFEKILSNLRFCVDNIVFSLKNIEKHKNINDKLKSDILSINRCLYLLYKIKCNSFNDITENIIYFSTYLFEMFSKNVYELFDNKNVFLNEWNIEKMSYIRYNNEADNMKDSDKLINDNEQIVKEDNKKKINEEKISNINGDSSSINANNNCDDDVNMCINGEVDYNLNNFVNESHQSSCMFYNASINGNDEISVNDKKTDTSKNGEIYMKGNDEEIYKTEEVTNIKNDKNLNNECNDIKNIDISKNKENNSKFVVDLKKGKKEKKKIEKNIFHKNCLYYYLSKKVLKLLSSILFKNIYFIIYNKCLLLKNQNNTYINRSSEKKYLHSLNFLSFLKVINSVDSYKIKINFLIIMFLLLYSSNQIDDNIYCYFYSILKNINYYESEYTYNFYGLLTVIILTDNNLIRNVSFIKRIFQYSIHSNESCAHLFSLMMIRYLILKKSFLIKFLYNDENKLYDQNFDYVKNSYILKFNKYHKEENIKMNDKMFVYNKSVNNPVDSNSILTHFYEFYNLSSMLNDNFKNILLEFRNITIFNYNPFQRKRFNLIKNSCNNKYINISNSPDQKNKNDLILNGDNTQDMINKESNKEINNNKDQNEKKNDDDIIINIKENGNKKKDRMNYAIKDFKDGNSLGFTNKNEACNEFNNYTYETNTVINIMEKLTIEYKNAKDQVNILNIFNNFLHDSCINEKGDGVNETIKQKSKLMNNTYQKYFYDILYYYNNNIFKKFKDKYQIKKSKPNDEEISSSIDEEQEEDAYLDEFITKNFDIDKDLDEDILYDNMKNNCKKKKRKMNEENNSKYKNSRNFHKKQHTTKKNESTDILDFSDFAKLKKKEIKI
ncbi:large ribosomal subunit nuclear export factor, putative [Plasmodium gallinaceum]|uniref:Large ribosomal subunit nuclear export factor, putative n=1 Tax=Plasmodium gallinaceum TaxID=5849 RepID=A0A1J1GQF6_PLAGA|nr:large ribosomal subunit nuclear export factor, putative [Plasmodium gallinaceum]CRG94773.1 large ribosomal subunit nuclear export factor, putative [Plasmodium gallinaceum]